MKKHVKTTTIYKNSHLYPNYEEIGEVIMEADNGILVKWKIGSSVILYVQHSEKMKLQSESDVFGTSHFEFYIKKGSEKIGNDV